MPGTTAPVLTPTEARQASPRRINFHVLVWSMAARRSLLPPFSTTASMPSRTAPSACRRSSPRHRRRHPPRRLPPRPRPRRRPLLRRPIHNAVVAGHTFVRTRNDLAGCPLANRKMPAIEKGTQRRTSMKYLMIVSSMALGLAMSALAQDAPPAANSAKQQGTVQPPTNRLDKLVPPMKGREVTRPRPASPRAGAASGEGEHPPTNRMGKSVPNMKSPNAASDLPAEQPPARASKPALGLSTENRGQAGASGLPFRFAPRRFACAVCLYGAIRYKARLDQPLRIARAGTPTSTWPRTTKTRSPEPRLPKGLRDIEAAELRQQQDMLAKIRAVYERYGFEPLETPAFEYTDALGKFLPDQDRPNEGVFSRCRDEDEQWLSLRYDLTAPLARYVAQNYQTLPKPFRRYAVGNVWRNEKPGPGRLPPVHAVRRRYGWRGERRGGCRDVHARGRHAGGAGHQARRLRDQGQQSQASRWTA